MPTRLTQANIDETHPHLRRNKTYARLCSPLTPIHVAGIDNGRINGVEIHHEMPTQELTFAFGP